MIAAGNPGRPTLSLALGASAEVLAVKLVEAGDRQTQLLRGLARRQLVGAMVGQKVTDNRSRQTFNQLVLFIGASITNRRWIFRFFAAPAEREQRLDRAASKEDRPARLLFAAFRRRSGCVPAEPYPPLKQ